MQNSITITSKDGTVFQLPIPTSEELILDEEVEKSDIMFYIVCDGERIYLQYICNSDEGSPSNIISQYDNFKK